MGLFQGRLETLPGRWPLCREGKIPIRAQGCSPLVQTPLEVCCLLQASWRPCKAWPALQAAILPHKGVNWRMPCRPGGTAFTERPRCVRCFAHCPCAASPSPQPKEPHSVPLSLPRPPRPTSPTPPLNPHQNRKLQCWSSPLAPHSLQTGVRCH